MGPQPNWSTIGNRLKWLREVVLGQSTRDFVRELKKRGVDISSHSTVLRCEDGTLAPDADYLRAILEMTGKDATWLLMGGDNPERLIPGMAEQVLVEVRKRLIELHEMTTEPLPEPVPELSRGSKHSAGRDASDAEDAASKLREQAPVKRPVPGKSQRRRKSI